MWENTKDNPNAQWFLNVDDATYLFRENMCDLLTIYDPSETWVFGEALSFGGHVFVSGGAGIIVSRGVMEILGPETDNCELIMGDDYTIGICMWKLGLCPTDISGFHWSGVAANGDNINTPSQSFHYL